MIYELSQTHAMLTEHARRLPPELFVAHVETAESLLQLVGRAPVTTESSVAGVHLALAHQVNFQVRQGMDGLLESAASSSNDRRSVTYRNRWVNPVAISVLSGVSGLTSSYSGTIKSVRSVGGSGGTPLSRYRGI